MNFDEFKDEAIESIMRDEPRASIISGKPIYVFAHANKDKVVTGGLEKLGGNLEGYLEAVRKINKSESFDYSALAVFSMVADLNKAEDPDEIKELMDNMDPADFIEFLSEEGLMTKSVSVRIERSDDKEASSILTLLLNEEEGVEDDVEIYDAELSEDQVKDNPFGDGLFWR